MPALACYHFVKGASQQRGKFAVGVFLEQEVAVLLRLAAVAGAPVEQEQVVVDVVETFRVGKVGQESQHGLLGQRKILEPLLLQDARLVESLGEQSVGLLHLFLGEWYLLEVELPVVRVVGQGVLACLLFLVGRLGPSCPIQAVGLLLAHLRAALLATAGQRLAVADAPVVHVGPLSPPLAELLLAPLHGGGVVEVPGPFLPAGGAGGGCLPVSGRSCGRVASPGVGRAGGCAVARRFLCLLLLFLFQGLYHAVDGCGVFRLGHLGQCLQAVLHLDCAQMRLQLTEYLAPALALLAVGVLLVQDGHARLVGARRIDVVFPLPVHLAQAEQEHGLRGAVLCGLLHALLPRAEAAGGVLHAQVDVAHGVIHLVQVVLVLVAPGHPLEP